MGRGRGIRVLEPNWSSGVRVFVSKNIYRTPTAVNPSSSCHPRKTEAPREDMTLLRSQSKLGRVWTGTQDTCTQSLFPLHQLLLQPEWPLKRTQFTPRSPPQLVFIESPLGQAWG